MVDQERCVARTGNKGAEMRYDEKDVRPLVQALEELAGDQPVADLALSRWRQATAPGGKNGRKGLAQHNYDPRPLRDANGDMVNGPGGWKIWHCVRCKRDATTIKGHRWYRESGAVEWREGPIGCKDRA